MRTITAALLKECMPAASADICALNAPHLDACMRGIAQINTDERVAAFLAQLAHESGSLHYCEEIADGTAYEARGDLGNSEPGDGPRYKGRGWIQITGRNNYRACGLAIGLPLIQMPELLLQPENAARGSAWFWSSKNLNAFADRIRFAEISRRIQGSYITVDMRIQHWLRIRKVLGI